MNCFEKINKVLAEQIEIIELLQEDICVHYHDFYELVYVRDGSADQTISEKSVKVKKGDYFIIDYGSSHGYRNCNNFKIINCIFKPEFIDKTLKNCNSFSHLITNHLIKFNYAILSMVPVNNVFFDTDGCIAELFSKLQNEYKMKNAGYLELMRCHLVEILVKSMRSIYNPDTKNIHPATKQILKYAEEHFPECITLSDLCADMSFSLPYISNRFKCDMGVTFSQHMQNIRVEQACRLLAETNMRITEIAGRVGYGDVKFFGKIFKNIVGMTPREFRKSIV